MGRGQKGKRCGKTFNVEKVQVSEEAECGKRSCVKRS